MPFALIYTRVSSDEQADDGVSLPAQVSECRRYVSRMGWDFGDELQDIETGRRDDRPSYQRLLATVRQLARDGQGAVVVVASLDRLGRSVAERVRAYEELARLGAPIHSVREGGLVPELTYNILAAVAQEESRKLSERVRASVRYVVDRGWHPVGRAPWGYCWRPATDQERKDGSPSKVLDINETEAPYVREVWDRVIAGESLQSIGRWICGLPPDARGGRNLPFSVVRRLIRAPVYVARQGDRVPTPSDVLSHPRARWPPMVSDATWQAAQRAIRLSGTMPRQASGDFPLTGLIRCPVCGSRMTGRTRKPGKSYRDYVCSSADGGARKPGPICYYVAAAGPVEEAVLGQVRAMLTVISRPRVRDAIRRAWAERERRATADDDTRRLAALEREIATARRRITDQVVKFLDGEIDRAAYDLTRARLSTELEAAETEQARLRGRVRPSGLPALESVYSSLSGWSRMLAQAQPRSWRPVLGELVERVEPIRIGYGKYRADIAWSPVGRALHEAAELLSPRPDAGPG